MACESTKKISILYVVESFSTGVYAIIKDIACNLNPDQFQLHIIHSLRADSPSNYADELSLSHISLEFVPMGKWFNWLKAIRRIRSRIKNLSPHIIHLHSSIGGFIGSMAAKGHPGLYYSPHGFSFLRTDVGRVQRKFFFQLEKFIRAFAGGTIVAVSQGELKEAYAITKNGLLINNFINTAEVPHRLPSEEPLILTTGRISYQKNPHFFNKIAEMFPEISFIWVGDGPLRTYLTAKNIHITGFLTRKETLTYLSKGWIYVQTSRWEGLPVSVLEAMAVGLPVIATNIIGNRDVIVNNITGYLIEEGDLSGFSNAIGEIIQDPVRREFFGDYARSLVQNDYDIKHAVCQYEALYNKGNCN
ncbi:MAG: glycosyltransferase [Spirochaetia bacterium]|nr:glycosyltransferase [Spirochaetia bacterium]